MAGPQKFWMVWNIARRAPKKRHTSRETAEAESVRLARLHPSAKFYVVEAIGYATIDTDFNQEIPPEERKLGEVRTVAFPAAKAKKEKATA